MLPVGFLGPHTWGKAISGEGNGGRSQYSVGLPGIVVEGGDAAVGGALVQRSGQDGREAGDGQDGRGEVHFGVVRAKLVELIVCVCCLYVVRVKAECILGCKISPWCSRSLYILQLAPKGPSPRITTAAVLLGFSPQFRMQIHPNPQRNKSGD